MGLLELAVAVVRIELFNLSGAYIHGKFSGLFFSENPEQLSGVVPKQLFGVVPKPTLRGSDKRCYMKAKSSTHEYRAL